MSALSAIYGAGVGLRNALYDGGVFRAKRLNGPVVSVGNVSAGGSGKTPLVLLLGELLKRRGVRFDILSRGYGRRTRGVALVDAAGSASEFGDEPLLMARRLSVPVIVGESRYEAGRFAEQKFGAQLHLLDDGLQHRSLARDFEIVLLTAEDLRDRLLPQGRLREPLTSLSRADAVVVSGEVATESLDLKARVWRMRRGIAMADVADRPVAFCGIARPQNFFSQLRGAGIEPVAEKAYRDHYAYTKADVHELLALQKRVGAAGFVTTEKDLVNLGELARNLDRLGVAVVTMELEDSASAVDSMLRTVGERRRGGLQELK
jgi:tetraacyldisaccharide 4'-kinase